MNTKVMDTTNGSKYQRFFSLDFARGLAIFVMLFLHIIQRTLNMEELFANINNVALINLFALVLIPFFGGLAGFFLIISAAANMVSIYRDLEKGKSIKSLVFKQVIGGLLLLIFAMLCEGLIGYQGLMGNFAKSLDNIANTEWTVMLWRWNFFETIHTIAWCLIINGCIQGLLSLKGNWKNTKRMIISYIILAVIVVGLTQPIWYLIGLLVPGYPFGLYPSGHELFMPWIGTESFWQIFRAPFLNPLSAPMEPIFPYLAISFIGSVLGIILSQPKDKISKKFPRNFGLVGLAMFIGGLVGIIIVIVKILVATDFDTAIDFYLVFINHRAWAADYASYVPPFAWIGQFLAVNGFSIMLIMFLFRLVEFRGKAQVYAERTKIVRRFGIVAFTNYNNQWMYFVVFFLTSLMLTKDAYQPLFWGGVFLTIVLTYLLYSLILFGWEKINYIGSLEWFIRTFTNNVIPARRKKFDSSVKWWQRGQVDVEKTFYNVDWINLGNAELDNKVFNEKSDEEKKLVNLEDSKFALSISLIGLCSILFIVLNILSLFVAIKTRKTEGKNKYNIAALIISIIGIVLFVALIIVTLILPIGILGIF
ncbi:MAG TPA: hypothetical protein VMX55_02005 [candidate division Zixibacteria bacterium]|nr:hypothetical protein [candidate division Zixibacteria bacterium]